MDNGVYITLSKQLALFQEMDVTANNIANANTTGYGSEHILFTSYLSKDVNKGDKNPMSFAHNISTYRDTQGGPVKTTGNALDVAINGEAYFAVETPLGTRYTRAGNFQISNDGTLTTPEGYPVLDISNQHITFDESARDIDIGGAGNIKVDGADFTTLNLVQFSNPQLLERLSGSLFKSDVAPAPAENATVVQGALEGSNVSAVSELTHMINVSRQVTTTSQMMSILFDLEGKTADTWAQQA